METNASADSAVLPVRRPSRPSCHPHQRATTPLPATEKSRDIHVMSTMTAMPPTAAECQYWSHSHSLPTATAGSPDSPLSLALLHAQELSPTYNTSVLLPPFTPLHWHVCLTLLHKEHQAYHQATLDPNWDAC